MADTNLITCRGCKQEKDSDGFFPDKRSKYSLRFRQPCRECWSDDRKRFREKNLERVCAQERASTKRRFEANGEKKNFRSLNWRLKYKFGITVEQYMEMIHAQNEKCAICEMPIAPLMSGSGNRGSACVDHDHRTSKVRAILCHGCNTAIGLFDDNPEIIERAASY